MGSIESYRWKVRRYWEAEVSLLEDPSLRGKLLRRLSEFMKCGQTLLVRSCMGCGEDRLGSGTYHGTRTCKTRACPVCAKVRAEKYADWAEVAFEKVPRVGTYAWRFITVTTKYDPTNEEDCTVAALRSRALACQIAGRALASKLVAQNPGSGMLRTIESGKRGMVHLNLVYYGPPVRSEDVARIAKKGGACIGHAFVLDVRRAGKAETRSKAEREEAPDERGSKAGLKRVARYVSKGLAHEDGHRIFDEDWQTGDMGVRTVDPELAARWEIATYRMHLSQKYGSLRSIDLDEHAEKSGPDHTNDADVACACCGEVGAFRTIGRNAVRWLERCHAVGQPGLHRTASNWKTLGDLRPPPPE